MMTTVTAMLRRGVAPVAVPAVVAVAYSRGVLGGDLRLDDLGVRRAAIEEFVVTAEPDDSAVVEYDDLVGVGDGRNALSDDKHCGVTRYGPQCCPKPRVGAEVKSRKGFVEQVDLGFTH